METKKAFRAMALCGMCLVFIWITAITIPFGSFRRDNWLVITTFVVNGIIWSALLIVEINKRAYSFTMIHWSFCLLFFFFAAFIQYAYDSFPWVSGRSDEILIKTNLLLTVWTISYALGGIMGGRKAERIKHEPFYLQESVAYDKLIPLLAVVSLLNTMYRVYSIGIMNMLARSTSSVTIVENGSIMMIIEKVLQASSYFAAVLCILRWKQKKRGLGMLIICGASLLLSYFPTSTARYVAAGIYLGLILTYSQKLKQGRVFVFLFIGAFMIILPFLNAFRNASFASVSIGRVLLKTIKNLPTAWLAGDYDAYTMLSLVIDYVEQAGSTWGKQLLGAVLFFVPRVIWPGKAVGSGYHVADSFGWIFKNVSCPLPGEGLINFGLIGVVIFGIVIGRLTAKLDKLYWKYIDADQKSVRGLDVIYPITVILFFFMSRGDLLSSYSYMIGYVAVWFVCIQIAKTGMRKR